MTRPAAPMAVRKHHRVTVEEVLDVSAARLQRAEPDDGYGDKTKAKRDDKARAGPKMAGKAVEKKPDGTAPDATGADGSGLTTVQQGREPSQKPTERPQSLSRGEGISKPQGKTVDTRATGVRSIYLGASWTRGTA